MEKEEYKSCDSATEISLDLAYQLLEQNQSKAALNITQHLFEEKKDCPAVFEYHGYSLFRTGEWLQGVQLLDSAIDRFGSMPDIILRKAYMSLEMAQSGVGMKNIDGNAVYLPASKQLPYDEAQFSTENYNSALEDLHYITDNYENRFDDIATMAGIYRSMNKLEESNAELEKLTKIFGYKDNALFSIADNNIALNKLDEAEKSLLLLLTDYPREQAVYKKLAELYLAKKDDQKAKEFDDKGNFFHMLPASSDLEYNPENKELLLYFADGGNKGKAKLKKLNAVYKSKPTGYTADICLAILKLHMNHGNGLEERATEILSALGKSVLPKTHDLFNSGTVSTCTITNLAHVMADIKDTSSWSVFVNYLPQMAYMPMTLIPPDVPAMMMRYDKEKGMMEILKFLKTILKSKNDAVEDPMNSISLFGQFVYYTPLQNVEREKLIAAAKGLDYSQEQLDQLLEKVYTKK